MDRGAKRQKSPGPPQRVNHLLQCCIAGWPFLQLPLMLLSKDVGMPPPAFPADLYLQQKVKKFPKTRDKLGQISFWGERGQTLLYSLSSRIFFFSSCLRRCVPRSVTSCYVAGTPTEQWLQGTLIACRSPGNKAPQRHKEKERVWVLAELAIGALSLWGRGIPAVCGLFVKKNMIGPC